MSNAYITHYAGVKAITPADATDNRCQAFSVTVAGVVAVVCEDGTTALVPAAAGILVPLAVKQILAAGTTATGIVGFV